MKLPADRVRALEAFYRERRVCVTGGTGFIGSHLVDALETLGASITVIDDQSNSSLDVLAGHLALEPDRVRIVNASILDDDALSDAIEDAKTVFHLAAIGSVPRSIEFPQRVWSVNATGTLRVLEAARRAGAERVVYAASSSAYGEQPELPKVETQMPQPMSPYAASKLAGEHLCATWSHCFNLSTVSLRYFNVFGPRQKADSIYAGVTASFSRKFLAGETPVIYGDGSQTRDFTFVANAVLGTLLAGCAQRPFKGEVINIGTGLRTSVGELAAVLARRCGVPHIRPELGPTRSGDLKHSQADISRARQWLNYEPFASLDDGVKETVEWYKEALAGAGGTEEVQA